MSGLHFIVSDYYATGEGRTLSILITLGDVRQDDYSQAPSYDLDKGIYKPGLMKTSMDEVLLREFRETFGDWFAVGARIIEKEDFLEHHSVYLPKAVLRVLEDRAAPLPFNFRYHSQLHLNFS